VDAHVGEHRLHELEGRDRAVELLALDGVGDRLVDAALADAHAARGDAEAPGVQRAHRDLEAVADRAEHGVVGTRTSSSASDAVSEPCRPIFPWISDGTKPGWSVSTRKQASPCA
jgi:hypothetical protein